MYERFYGLRERPFSLTPDPDYLFPSIAHREALSYLRYALEGHAGMVVITGEIGSGKTTLLQTVMRGLDRQTSVARLVNTLLNGRELIEAIMIDFGLEPAAGHSKPMLLRDLAQFLVGQRLAGRLALLIIDEAQNLSAAALEEVRMLSNLETEKSKLLQIILVGQPELRQILARPTLEQLRQRVTTSYHLRALDADDTHAYINHRLRRAAIGAPMELERQVTDLIYRASQGVPRRINVIADATLLFGYGEDRKVVDEALVRDVLGELQATGVIAAPAEPAQAAAAAPAVEAAPVAPAIEAAAAPRAARVPEATPPQGVRTAPPPPAPAAPVARPALAAGQLAERERELAARHADLAMRERQLAEQRRLMADRLDRMRPERAAPPAAPPRPTARPATPLPQTVAMATDSAWTRIRRTLFGIPAHIFQD